jgi:hypothetical protein
MIILNQKIIVEKAQKNEELISSKLLELNSNPFIKIMHQIRKVLVCRSRKQLKFNRITQMKTKREIKYIQKV